MMVGSVSIAFCRFFSYFYGPSNFPQVSPPREGPGTTDCGQGAALYTQQTRAHWAGSVAGSLAAVNAAVRTVTCRRKLPCHVRHQLVLWHEVASETHRKAHSSEQVVDPRVLSVGYFLPTELFAQLRVQ